MNTSLRQRVHETSHPRLTILVIGGLAFIALAGAITLVDFTGFFDVDWFGFRLGVIGYLLLVSGVAGYLALGVSNRLPNP